MTCVREGRESGEFPMIDAENNEELDR